MTGSRKYKLLPLWLAPVLLSGCNPLGMGFYTPIPVQPDLYAAHRPHADDVVAAVLDTVRY